MKKNQSKTKPSPKTKEAKTTIKSTEKPKRDEVTCTIKELATKLLKDSESLIKESKKWPLIVDVNGVASTFIRHRDVNYINTMDSRNMELSMLKLALLGALRYGKPVVVDLMDLCDTFKVLCQLLDQISPNLADNIFNKTIIQENVYSKLLADIDDPEYNISKFSDLYVNQFQFIVLTSSENPPDVLLDTFITFKVE